VTVRKGSQIPKQKLPSHVLEFLKDKFTEMCNEVIGDPDGPSVISASLQGPQGTFLFIVARDDEAEKLKSVLLLDPDSEHRPGQREPIPGPQ
jgi:hypothetical protein